MIKVEIPGRGLLEIENVLLDFNGTLAEDGRVPPSTRERLRLLAERCALYVLTADTYGTARAECAALPVLMEIFEGEGVAEEKRKTVQRLGAERCCCIGNGYNDVKMFQAAALQADILVRSIDSALELLLKPERIKADLRS